MNPTKIDRQDKEVLPSREDLPAREADPANATTLTETKYSDLVRQLRKGIGLTQAQLAEKLDVSTRTVARWEAEEAAPSVEQHRKLWELACVAGVAAGGAGLAAGVAAAGGAGLAAGLLLGPIAPMAALAGGAAWWAMNRRRSPAAETSALPAVLRDALLGAADELDVSPRKLRGAVLGILDAAESAGMSSAALRAGLEGTTESGDGK